MGTKGIIEWNEEGVEARGMNFFLTTFDWRETAVVELVCHLSLWVCLVVFCRVWQSPRSFFFSFVSPAKAGSCSGQGRKTFLLLSFQTSLLPSLVPYCSFSDGLLSSKGQFVENLETDLLSDLELWSIPQLSTEDKDVANSFACLEVKKATREGSPTLSPSSGPEGDFSTNGGQPPWTRSSQLARGPRRGREKGAQNNGEE